MWHSVIVILVYLFASYGLCNVLVYGTGPFDIILKIHSLAGRIHHTFSDMLSCMMCTSTNIGWMASLFNILIVPSVPITPMMVLFGGGAPWWLTIFMDTFVTTGVVWLIHTAQESLESLTNYLNGDERQDS